MRDAESHSRHTEGLERQSVWYTGGGVYKVAFGVRIRGAQAAMDWLRENRREFYNSVEVGGAERRRRERHGIPS